MKTSLCLLDAALFLAASPAFAQGTLTYDQQSATTTNVAVTVSIPLQTEQPLGQSFTPTLSSIGFVQLLITNVNGSNPGSTLGVNLLAGSITGTLIASTDPVILPPDFTFGAATFYFASPVSLIPSTQYFLQPVLQSGDPGVAVREGAFNYAGGEAYYLGFQDPSLDLWFREGITPEPATWALLLTGAALLYLRRRR